MACQTTCVTLMPGDRLRLSVAAAFPAYPVNPATGTDPRRAMAMVPITCERASSLVLPRLVP